MLPAYHVIMQLSQLQVTLGLNIVCWQNLYLIVGSHLAVPEPVFALQPEEWGRIMLKGV